MRDTGDTIVTKWESEFTVDDHVRMADMLADVFGAADPRDREQFADGRSWAGARPEFRLLAHDDDGIAAHIAFLRRFVGITDHSQLVVELGLVAVRADRRGSGLGGQMLDEATKLLTKLAAPFGFLSCKPDSASFYARNGWHRVAARARHPHNSRPLEVIDAPEIVFVKPIVESIDRWPAGDAIEWNGFKL